MAADFVANGTSAERATQTGRATRPLRPVVLSTRTALVFALAVALLFAVPGGMLWLIGFNYEGVTGSPLTKIHPGTYVIVALVFWLSLQSGNPIRFGAVMARRHPGCLVLLVAAVIAFLQVAVRSAPGLAGMVDSFMLPAIALALLAETDGAGQARIETVIHVIMIANATLGLFEMATNQRFFPFRLDGELYPNDTRSSALQGHPLINATVTAVYILALVNGGGASISPTRRAAIVVLEFAAMVAFGGRTALVVALALGGLMAAYRLLLILRSGRIPMLGAAISVLLLTLTPILLATLWHEGFFDALVGRFESDNGSANARVEMLSLISAIPISGLLFGPDVGLVDDLRRVSGLEQGIENPVVRLLLYQGALIALLLCVAVGLFLTEIVRRCRRGVWLPLFGFLIIINSFESLASKTTLLAKCALMMAVLFRRADSSSQPVRRPSAPSTAGSKEWDTSSARPMPSNRFQNAQPKPRSSAASRTSRI